MRRTILILLAAALLTGCIPEPQPDYCYRMGSTPTGGVVAWYCEGRAQFPADTLPDNLKDEYQPPVVAP